jgi:hypothetical protein
LLKLYANANMQEALLLNDNNKLIKNYDNIYTYHPDFRMYTYHLSIIRMEKPV